MRLADEHIEAYHVERQPQDSVQGAVRLVSAHVPPSNRDCERIGHFRERELRDDPANVSGDDCFDPCGASRVVLSKYAPDEGACVKDRLSARSHGPVE